MFAVGALIEKGIIEKVVEDIETNSLLVTFGVSICIVNISDLDVDHRLQGHPLPLGLLVLRLAGLSKTPLGGRGLRPRADGARLLFSQILPPRQGHPRHGGQPRSSGHLRHLRQAHLLRHLRAGERDGRGRGRAGEHHVRHLPRDGRIVPHALVHRHRARGDGPCRGRRAGGDDPGTRGGHRQPLSQRRGRGSHLVRHFTAHPHLSPFRPPGPAGMD